MPDSSRSIAPEDESLSREIDKQVFIIDNDPDPQRRKAAHAALAELLERLPPGVGEKG
jgi:hypothetical protein